MHPVAIRKKLADIISSEKAYDVPGICTALGLLDGTNEEAFASKFRYVKRRLDLVDLEQLQNCAVKLNSLVESSDLSELLSDILLSSPADDLHRSSLALLNTEMLNKRWQAALDRRDSDPEGAITLARTLLEDVCKIIITEMRSSFGENDDLPKLYRKVAALLQLAPDQHAEQIFKQVLGSIQQTIEGLGAIRNKLSDAHSTGPLRARATSRHAKLAVNLAGTMATFLAETFVERTQSK